MPRSAATLRAFTSVTPDDRIGLNRPASTALTIMSVAAVGELAVIADADASCARCVVHLRDERPEPLAQRRRTAAAA